MKVRSQASTKQERRSRSHQAWRRFVRERGEPADVPPEIARSWLRCRDVHALDPGARRPRRCLDLSALAERRRGDDAFRMLAPLLPEFTSRVGASDHVLAWFDAEGILLALDGDPRVAERAQAEIGFEPGACWAEDSAGTCGPALALATGEAVEVFASEHWLEALHPWSDAAAPVLVPGSAAPVGVIDVTGPWEVHRRQALELTRAIARAIEERVGAAASVRDEVVRHAMRMAREAGDALVAVDVRGRVIAANDAAARRRVIEAQALTPSVRAALDAALRGPSPADDGDVRLAFQGGGAIVVSLVRHAGAPVGAVVRVLGTPGAAAAGRARPRPATRYDFESILGRSATFRRAVEQARGAAANDLPVVLSGESGTGKELFAQSIHAGSSRRAGPFIALNCGSLPGTLIESELFGYEPGAFTGATREGKSGRFEVAAGGTLFLDEVSELPPSAQAALLRVLQEGEVVRLGGSAPRRVDVRVLAATNRPLDLHVRDGHFRRDLYYRLNVLPIAVPPLRERGEDVVLLAGAFLAEAEAEVGRTGLSLAPDAAAALQAYAWPGNVRELRNAILRAAAMAPAEMLHASDLVLEPLDGQRGQAGGSARPAERPAREDRAGRKLERAEIEEAIRVCGNNFTRAAAHLGVSRMTLYRWARRLGVATPHAG
jgi:transcriptional regulator of acetoin/glycerol metabolism